MAIIITGVIRGTSSEKLFKEPHLKTVKSRCGQRKLCLFYEHIKKLEKLSAYFFQLIPGNNTPYTTRSVQKS